VTCAQDSHASLYVRGREFSTGIHRGNRVRCFTIPNARTTQRPITKIIVTNTSREVHGMRYVTVCVRMNTLPVLNVTEVIVVVSDSEFLNNPDYRSV
jgi:hypothetical protein